MLFVHILSGYLTYDRHGTHKAAVADADDLLSLGAENDDCHALLGQAMDDAVDLFLGAYVTPWLGLSRISTLGSDMTHLARTTFCWLPPENGW